MTTPLMSSVICAWCKTLIRRLDDPTTGTSHGICSACLEKYFPEPATLKHANCPREGSCLVTPNSEHTSIF